MNKVGEHFLKTTDPQAWGVGMDVLGYRSSLNATLPLPTAGQETFSASQSKWLWDYELTGESPDTNIQLRFYGNTVPNRAAIFQRIGSELNTDKKFGPLFLSVEAERPGASIHLDGFQLRNVIFRNLRIVHRGGPVRLENTFFLNCTFQIEQRDESSVRLAQSILGASTVSVRI